METTQQTDFAKGTLKAELLSIAEQNVNSEECRKAKEHLHRLIKTYFGYGKTHVELKIENREVCVMHAPSEGNVISGVTRPHLVFNYLVFYLREEGFEVTMKPDNIASIDLSFLFQIGVKKQKLNPVTN